MHEAKINDSQKFTWVVFNVQYLPQLKLVLVSILSCLKLAQTAPKAFNLELINHIITTLV